MCIGYVAHIGIMVLQLFYNFINVQYPFFLVGRMAFLKSEL